MERALVDIDDPATWPSRVTEWIAPYVHELRGTTRYTSDLAVPLEREDELRALLAGQRMLAYHCTRLLDHEVAEVVGDGLLPLTLELVNKRIDAAHAHGDLSDGDRERLRERNVFALNEAQYRENQVCLVLGRGGLDDTGVVPLMSRWGGEAIYTWDPDSEEPAAFIGRPTVVVTGVDLSVSHTVAPTYASLGKMFVGALIRTEHRVADVFMSGPVPAEDIVAIWRPGDPDYDRHPTLPRA